LICYYRFGLVSIIIAGKYYFFGWIDILFGPLPNETVSYPQEHGLGMGDPLPGLVWRPTAPGRSPARSYDMIILPGDPDRKGHFKI
jgi:hypothetical protein